MMKRIKKTVTENRFSILTALLAVILTAGGLLAVYSVTKNGDISRFFVQGFAAILGILVFMAILLFPPKKIGKRFLCTVFVCMCALLLFTVFVGQGPGNNSWLRIPGLFFDIQPSELAKVLYLLTLSYHLSALENTRLQKIQLLHLTVHILLPILLVLLQKDVGNAAVFVLVTLCLLLFWGVKLRYYAIGAGVLCLLSPVVWNALGTHRQKRILAGFFPLSDPYGLGWQSITAQRAISHGGLFGRGFGCLEYALSVPALHTDMIFVAICEQFGFLGGGTVIVLLFSLCLVWVAMSRYATKQGALLCLGGTVLLCVQTFEVICMSLGLLPIVGVTLPFVSYGGSSLFSMWLLCALIIKTQETKS